MKPWIRHASTVIFVAQITATISEPAKADATCRWNSHFDNGTSKDTVLAKDGKTLFGITCGLPMGRPQMGIELNVGLSGTPYPVQVIVDGHNYSATLKDGSSNAVTRSDKTAIGDMITALFATRSSFFTVDIPDLKWSEQFSTLGARRVLTLPPKNGEARTVVSDCM
jgi:hypothetical protein